MTSFSPMVGEPGGELRKLIPWLRRVNLGFSVPESGANGYVGQRPGRYKPTLPEAGLPAGCMVLKLLRTYHRALLSHRPQPTLIQNFITATPCWRLGDAHMLKAINFLCVAAPGD